MPQQPTADTPPDMGQGTDVDSGASLLDSLAPASPQPADKGAAAEPEPEAGDEPGFEQELDSMLGLEAPEKEGDEPDPEPEPEGGEEPEMFSVINEDGSIERVSREEARNRTLRQQDYTRKTQALAEERKKAEAEAVALRDDLGKARDRYIEQLKQLEAVMDVQEPDWAKVQAEDPDRYLTLRENWRTQREAKERAAAKRKQLEDERQAELSKKFEGLVRDEQRRLLEKLPALTDPKQGPAIREAMVRAATEHYGFTADDLRQTVDHRAWLMLRDATLFRQIYSRRQEVRQRAKKGNGKSKTLSPGTSAPTSTRRKGQKDREFSKALDTVRSTGDRDAAAAALDFLDL